VFVETYGSELGALTADDITDIVKLEFDPDGAETCFDKGGRDVTEPSGKVTQPMVAIVVNSSSSPFFIIAPSPTAPAEAPDCRPGAIAKSLQLREPKYVETAAYCHFGREPREENGIGPGRPEGRVREEGRKPDGD